MSETHKPAIPKAKSGRGWGGRWALLLAAGFVILSVLLTVPYVQRRQRIEAIASQARAAVVDGPIDQARPLVKAWRAVAPDDGEVDYYLAWLELRATHFSQAMDAVRVASKKGFSLEQLEILRAIMLAQAGRFEESIPTLFQAFQRDSGPLAEIADTLMRFYMQTIQLDNAFAVLKRWMEVAPQDVRPYVWRAEVYKRAGREGELIVRDLREALRRDPSLVDTRLELATSLDPSQIVEAEEEYGKVLEQRPKNTTALVGLGKLLILKGDLVAATRHFEDALAVDPNLPRALRELALLDVKFGRLKQARERLERAVKLEPDDLEMQYAYTRVLAASGDAKAAAEQTKVAEQLRKDQKRIEELRNQLATQPENLDLRLDVARWLIDHGHDEEGLDWTKRILEKQSDHPATCRLLADYYTRKKNPGLANYYRLLVGQTGADNPK